MYMRNRSSGIRSATLVAAFALTAISVFGSTAGTPVRMSSRTEPVIQQISSDIKRIQFANGINVEQLRSEAGRLHLQNVKMRHPDAFAASRADMLARGFVPTNEVFVERIYHQAANRRQSNKNRKQSNDKQYYLTQTSSEQDSDGEIIFESYEGPGNTWQGTIYMELYADGAATTWDGQIDTSSEDYPYNWATETWSYAGDDASPFDLGSMKHPPLPGSISRSASIQYAAWKPGQTVFPAAVNWFNWAYCWRTAVLGGCGTAAVGCIRVTAAWPACFATWCIGAEVSGGVVCAIENWH